MYILQESVCTLYVFVFILLDFIKITRYLIKRNPTTYQQYYVYKTKDGLTHTYLNC